MRIRAILVIMAVISVLAYVSPKEARASWPLGGGGLARVSAHGTLDYTGIAGYSIGFRLRATAGVGIPGQPGYRTPAGKVEMWRSDWGNLNGPLPSVDVRLVDVEPGWAYIAGPSNPSFWRDLPYGWWTYIVLHDEGPRRDHADSIAIVHGPQQWVEYQMRSRIRFEEAHRPVLAGDVALH